MSHDHGIAEGMLSDCEMDLRLLRGQLADQNRQLQRLLTVEKEQAAEIKRLEELLNLLEAAASV